MKLAGAAMVICAFTYGGLSLCFLMKKRCTFWESFIRALEVLKPEIGFCGANLKDALISASRISAQPLFERAALNIEENGADKAWSLAVEECSLSRADKKALLIFSSKLGKTDAKTQLRHIEYMEGIAGEIKKNADERYRRIGMLCARCGILAGFFTAIVLL